MYSLFVCSRATVSRWNVHLWSWQLDLFCNTIILVLLRFTVRAQVWHNLCRRSRCCCRPSLVGDRSTRSSANSRHLTSDSCRVRLGAADISSARANSFIYMLKRVGLKLHPCLTPRPISPSLTLSIICQSSSPVPVHSQSVNSTPNYLIPILLFIFLLFCTPVSLLAHYQRIYHSSVCGLFIALPP